MVRSEIVSMEPRQFSRGNRSNQETRNLRIPVSMEPRQFSRGNIPEETYTFGQDSCFNGATAIQPWELGSFQLGVVENSSFNGATAIQPWER